nr:hypothetical protein [uncultured Carboxylicivirga sp.]
MLPFDENNIRKAFEKWENEPAPLAYNKNNILNKLNIGSTPMWHQHLMQVAAIALILLLSGALGYALVRNNQAHKDNNLLLSEQIKQQQQLKQLRDSLQNNHSGHEIKYVTVVKEKKVADPDCNQNQLEAQHQIASLEKENMSLKSSLQQLSVATDELNDSIQTLLTNMNSIEEQYMTMLDKMKNKGGFDINYNQQMIASTNNSKPLHNIKRPEEEKVQIKLGSGPAGTAPIRRSFSFNN